MTVNWHELTPRCYDILDFLQFNFLRALRAFRGLPWIGWDPISEYLSMAKRKEYAQARKIAWIMAVNIKDLEK